MSIEKCKDFEKDGYGTWDDSSKPTTYANMYDFMKNQNNVVMALSSGLWQPSTAYTAGQVVHSPSLPAGCKATCTTEGTTGSTEPKWTAYGTTVTDGTVKWKVETDVQGTMDGEMQTAITSAINTLHDTIKTEMQTSITSAINTLHDTIKTEMQTAMLALFPVGTILETTNSANPSTYIGGTWEQLPGGYSLISAGDYSEKHTVNGTENTYSQTYEAGKTYGEMLHQLTVDELASHSHQQYVTANPDSGTYNTRLDYNKDEQNLSIFPQVLTGDTGGNLPHNNMPPVYGTYLFKRIS